jgi:Flp pilus assembly pilin Flp
MQRWLLQLWHEDDGVLSFEWTLIAVLLVFGIVAGVAAVRDTIIDELGDLAEAALQFDQSYSFAGIPALGIPSSEYDDALGTVTDCNRQMTFWGVNGPDDALPDGA